MASPFPRQPCRGFSLIELLLVLGVLAIIMVAAFVVYRSVSTSSQARQASTQMAMIAAGMEAIKRRATPPYANPYAGISLSTLHSARLVPQSMLQGPAMRNAFGGGAMVTASSANSTSCSSGSGCRKYTVTFMDVPVEACPQLANGISKAFDSIYIQGTSGARQMVQSPATGLSVEALTQACNLDPTRVRVFAVGG